MNRQMGYNLFRGVFYESAMQNAAYEVEFIEEILMDAISWEMGYNAGYNSGEVNASNPYLEGSSDYLEWEDGCSVGVRDRQDERFAKAFD